MESGRRWKDEDIPKTQWDLPHFLGMPAAELYGIQRIEYEGTEQTIPEEVTAA